MAKNYYNHGNPEKWDEFGWEREMRRDDRRISWYFRELPGVIDLPGEEDIIFEEIMRHPDLVPTEVNDSELQRYFSWRDPGYSSRSEEDEEFDEQNESFFPAVNHELLEVLDALCAEWNFAAASAEERGEGKDLALLRISVDFGKLIARLNDALAIADDKYRALKRCLLKRSLKDLNDLAGDLAFVAPHLDGVCNLNYYIESLGQIRDRIIDQIK